MSLLAFAVMFPSSTEKSGYTSLILRALERKALDAWDELLDPFDLERVGCTMPTEPLIRSECTIPFPLLESAIPVAFSWWSLSIWAVLWTGEVGVGFDFDFKPRIRCPGEDGDRCDG